MGGRSANDEFPTESLRFEEIIGLGPPVELRLGSILSKASDGLPEERRDSPSRFDPRELAGRSPVRQRW